MTSSLPRTAPLLKYKRLLARLFHLRALGPVPDDIEEVLAEALNDCRSEMTEAEEEQIGGIITRMRGIKAPKELRLLDTDVSVSPDPRRAA